MSDVISGKSILLTGATRGIGLACARSLAGSGARLLLHGRDKRKLRKWALSLRRKALMFRRSWQTFPPWRKQRLWPGRSRARVPLDVLINNAGIGFGVDGKKRELSRDGHELRFAVNYLAPFLLTEELLARGLPRLAVINVASAGQETLDFDDLMTERGYSGVRAYCSSKLALIMMSFDLAALHPGLQVQSLHPGTYLDTRMVREAGITPLGPVSRGVDSILGVLASALSRGSLRARSTSTRPGRRARLRRRTTPRHDEAEGSQPEACRAVALGAAPDA